MFGNVHLFVFYRGGIDFYLGTELFWDCGHIPMLGRVGTDLCLGG